MKRSWAVRLHEVFKNMYAQKFTSLFKEEVEIQSWIDTWSLLDCSLEAMQTALIRIPVQFPEWPPTFGEFRALLKNHISEPYVALPPPVKSLPTPEQAEKLDKVIHSKTKGGAQWWTTDKVVNQSQVDFIILQANHFGKDSQADRFLKDCRAAGVIAGNSLA